MPQNDLIYSEHDTFPDLYDKLNNKYLNPVVTSNLILAKAIREHTEAALQVYADEVSDNNVIHGEFGDFNVGRLPLPVHDDEDDDDRPVA